MYTIPLKLEKPTVTHLAGAALDEDDGWLDDLQTVPLSVLQDEGAIIKTRVDAGLLVIACLGGGDAEAFIEETEGASLIYIGDATFDKDLAVGEVTFKDRVGDEYKIENTMDTFGPEPD